MAYEYPMVSIILPVFNRRPVIHRALASVSSQTFGDYELLIVDDGSTDGLEEEILPLVLQRPNWRFLKHANRKLPQTRNIGIHAALGRYVTFLDSDDEYAPEHLHLRVEYMRRHPEVDVIHGGIELIGPEESHWVIDARDPARKIHIQDCCVGATLFGKKEVFFAVGGFPDLPYSAESHLLEKLERRFRIRKVAYPTYRYHTGGEDRLCRKREREQQFQMRNQDGNARSSDQ